MKYYLLLRQGAISTETLGLFMDRELAAEAYEIAKALEPDDYHCFLIREMELNKLVEYEGISLYMGSPHYNYNDELIGTDPRDFYPKVVR